MYNLDMTLDHDGRFLSYDESWQLPIPEIKVTGQFSLEGRGNYEVKIYPDVKSGHRSDSPHPLDGHPTTHFLIPHVIATGRHYPSTSQDPRHVERSKNGHTEVYQLDNVYEMFNNETTWSTEYPRYSMVVPVYYPFDGSENRAVTFYVAPNPTGRDLG